MHIPQQVSDRVKEAPAQALRAVFAGIGQVLLTADRVRSRAAEYQRARAEAAQANQAPQEAQPAQPRQDRPPAARGETRWRSLDETGNVRLLSRDEYHEPDVPAEAALSETAASAAEPAAAPEGIPEPTPEPVAEPSPDAIAEPTTEAEPVPEPVVTAEDLAIEPEPEPAAEATPAEPAPAAEATPAEPAPAAEATYPEPEAATAGAPEPAAAEAAAGAPAEQPRDERLIVLPVPNYDGLTVPSLRARLRNLDPAQLRALIDYEKANAGRADVLTMFERRIAKLETGNA
jgi:hypothetical protein